MRGPQQIDRDRGSVIPIASRAAPRRSLRLARRFRRRKQDTLPRASPSTSRCSVASVSRCSRFAAKRPCAAARSTATRSETTPDDFCMRPLRCARAYRPRPGIGPSHAAVASAKTCGSHFGDAGVNVLASRSAASNSAGHGASAAALLQGDCRRHRMELDETAFGIEKQLLHPRQRHRRVARVDAACRGRRRERFRAGSIPEDQRGRTADPKVGPPCRRTVLLCPLAGNRRRSGTPSRDRRRRFRSPAS